MSFCQEAIFRVVAAILHIGNIDFAKGREVDSSAPKDDKAKFHLKTTSELLMYGCHCIITLYAHMIFDCLFKMIAIIGFLILSGAMFVPWKMHYVSVS